MGEECLRWVVDSWFVVGVGLCYLRLFWRCVLLCFAVICCWGLRCYLFCGFILVLFSLSFVCGFTWLFTCCWALIAFEFCVWFYDSWLAGDLCLIIIVAAFLWMCRWWLVCMFALVGGFFIFKVWVWCYNSVDWLLDNRLFYLVWVKLLFYLYDVSLIVGSLIFVCCFRLILFN